MRYFIFFCLFFNSLSLAQEALTNNSNLFSPTNVRKFADYLFTQRDYLRAIDEYQRYPSILENDTVNFKIGFAYSEIGNNQQAAEQFLNTSSKSIFFDLSKLEYLKSIFKENNFEKYRETFENLKLKENYIYFRKAKELFYFSYLFSDECLPPKVKFLETFSSNQNEISKFYDWKTDPPYKSALTAVILSSIIPGAGKIYTEKYADGIMAFLATGILGYISYTDFKAAHRFRAWVFSALTVGFYGGNIYGSAASAFIFNAKIKFDFIESLKNFLEKNNYFIPKINF